MNMYDFLNQAAGREKVRQLAEDCGSSFAYFSQIAHGHRLPSPRLALLIERKSDGLVTRRELRPDIYPDEAAAPAAQDAA